jgi:hypothetical protein
MADDKTPQTPQPANQPDQAEIDRVVEQRLAREREQNAKRLKALGFESWEAAEQWRAKQGEEASKAEEAKRAELTQQQQFKTLYETERKKAEEREADLSRQIQELTGKHTTTVAQMRVERVQRELVAAASAAGAVAPDQISALLQGRVSMDEQGALVVLGADGKPATDGKGGALSVSALVGEFIAKNPHFARAAPGAGAGGQAPSGAPSGAVDLKKILASNNPAEIVKHREQIIAFQSSQRERGG